MTTAQLHAAVARATGEDRDLIAIRGFSLVDEDAPVATNETAPLQGTWRRGRAGEVVSTETGIVPGRMPRPF